MFTEPLFWPLHAIDFSRRMVGQSLDAWGLGPHPTPSRIILDRPGFCLRAYEPPANSVGLSSRPRGPAILIGPAPIKSASIWDLMPQRSVVRAALAQGWRVFMLAWKRPSGRQGEWGLAQYADVFWDEAVAAVREQTGVNQVILLSHSLGGTLAGIYASLHPGGVAAMVLLEAPLCFSARDDAFAPLVAAVPRAALGRQLGTVPGVALNLLSGVAAPDVFQWSRTLDLLASLSSWEEWLTHQRVERWTLDELPMPGRLFDEVVELLYRRNAFMTNDLFIGDRLARPAAISAPVLSVYNPHSRLIPAEMVRGFHAALPNPRSRMVEYRAEVGVALEHVGPLVGRQAHAELWPRIFGWLDEQR